MAGRTCERGFCTATPAIQTRCRLRQAPSGIHRESAKLDSLRVGRSFPEAHQPTIQHVPAKTKDKGGQVSPRYQWGSFKRVFGKRSASGRRRAGVWGTCEPVGLCPPLWWVQAGYPYGGTSMACERTESRHAANPRIHHEAPHRPRCLDSCADRGHRPGVATAARGRLRKRKIKHAKPVAAAVAA